MARGMHFHIRTQSSCKCAGTAALLTIHIDEVGPAFLLYRKLLEVYVMLNADGTISLTYLEMRSNLQQLRIIRTRRQLQTRPLAALHYRLDDATVHNMCLFFQADSFCGHWSVDGFSAFISLGQ